LEDGKDRGEGAILDGVLGRVKFFRQRNALIKKPLQEL